MRRLITFVSLVVTIILITGCGSQNEYLSKGKEWIKSDKRGKIPKAVAQFELAIEHEPDNAEAHYLLGYYDDGANIEHRAEQMVLAYTYDKRKYLKVLIEETLRDRDEKIRKSAALALQKIHAKESIIKPLVKTLKSKDSRDRDDAALVLSKLANHKEIVRRLIEKDILKHKRMATRFDAVRALGDIGDPEAIDALMNRITAQKGRGERNEESEVREAAVVALRHIARRDIDITGEPFDFQVKPTEGGVEVVGAVPDKMTLQNGEIITHIIDNKPLNSREEYNRLLAKAMESGKEITFGLPKIVKVRVSNAEELGIKEVKPSPDGRGVTIERYEIDSRARKMGIEKGEVISLVNGQKVNSEEDFKGKIEEAILKGKELSFRIADEEKYRLLSIPVPEDGGKLGMILVRAGVVVTKVQPNSPAEEAGILKDQVISYINDRSVGSLQDYEEIINISSGKELKLSIADEDGYRILSISIPKNVQDLGMTVKELSAGDEGLVVGDVKQMSPAVEAGIREGQIISYIVIRESVDSVDDYKQLIREGLTDGKVAISVLNKTAVSRLIDVLRNKGLTVRYAAAQALGEIGDKTVVDSLIEMLEEQANPIEIAFD